MKTAQCRVETEEQQGASQSVADPEDDSTREWLEDDEAEYQSPEDDGELSFEDTEAAGVTPGTVRVSRTSSQTPVFLRVLHTSAAQPAAWQDALEAQLSIAMWTLQVHADVFSMRLQDQEGNVLMGRFNRPRIMMDMFEYQGTKAAELAGEDYAAANRVSLSHISLLTGATARHLHLEVPDRHATQALGSMSNLRIQKCFCDQKHTMGLHAGSGRGSSLSRHEWGGLHLPAAQPCASGQPGWRGYRCPVHAMPCMPHASCPPRLLPCLQL